MKVNVYYGGRGLIEDPTLYVLNKITEILGELRVEVIRYNLYEQKSNINVLPKTLKEADGVVLATHLEWMGIGGLMQQFLDACWLYGDKDCLSRLYMMPVVMASTYGERDVECSLIKAWELLGGIPVDGLCAYVEDTIAFETNSSVMRRIEKRAESFYRDINQKSVVMPNSSNEVRTKVQKTKAIKLTPQESEQLSEYVSNDEYVKKQKEDIEELALMFKGMLGDDNQQEDKYLPVLKESYRGSKDVKVNCQVELSDLDKNILLRVDGENLECTYETGNRIDVRIKMSSAIFDSIISGAKTFQSAFMAGDLSAKGNFGIIRALDMVFDFTK